MLVDELAAVVDLVVDHDKDVLLCVVLGNILVGVLLGGHDGRIGSKCFFFLVSGIRREIRVKNARATRTDVQEGKGRKGKKSTSKES